METDIVQRIERLEAECQSLRASNRHWRMATLAAILGLISFSACGSGAQTPTKVIEAELFRVRDASSRVVAEFGVHPKGGNSLRLIDEKGIERLTVASKKDGSPLITLFDERDKARINLSIGTDGDATQVLMDGQERPLAVTRAYRDGNSNFILYGTDGQGKVGLEVNRDGNVSVALQQKQKDSRIQMTADPHGGVALNFFDRNERSRVTVGIQPDGVVSHSLANSKGKAVLDFHVMTDDGVGQIIGASGGDQFVVIRTFQGYLGVGIQNGDERRWLYQSKE